ncbi:phosphodiester glycosidase family protein [Szabonella alba]|uniref:Phosphodiester glycosidase family protein n=1 Tax=Szabonella alba TaxID=2804194 RepID=A0A8K0Y0B6_9RHOB|nr:phosphodiester glycosidase family protein [Szabonella alba]MBL4916953.1 phosphodiester glycosidase family protein [Szabonella alba]
MRVGLAALLPLLGAAAHAQTAVSGCREVVHAENRYTLCTVTADADLRIFQTDASGGPLGSFTRVNALLAAEGRRLAFAMNAGMYHSDRRPVGLMVEEGTERAPLVTAEGPGNFGMLPNGVFCILPDRFALVESRAFAAAPPDCRFATQSGPMLVIDGELHPRFLEGSDSRFIRNGIGISRDGRSAHLVISRQPVNFIDFARFFRDGLDSPQALYLDGKISRLYAPDIGRNDFGLPMGPIVGLVVPGTP